MLAPLQPLHPRPSAPTASAAFHKCASGVNVKNYKYPKLLLQQKSTRRALSRQRGDTTTAGAGNTREYAHVRCYELTCKSTSMYDRCWIDAVPFRTASQTRHASSGPGRAWCSCLPGATGSMQAHLRSISIRRRQSAREAKKKVPPPLRRMAPSVSHECAGC